MISYRLSAAIVVTAAVAVFGITHLTAQDPQSAAAPAEQKGDKKGDRKGGGGGGFIKIVNELTDLTAEQKEKLKTIQAEHTEKAKQLRESAGTGDAKPDKEAMKALRPKMQELMKDVRTQVESVLTDAQKKELDEKLAAAGGLDKKGGKKNKETSGTATP